MTFPVLEAHTQTTDIGSPYQAAVPAHDEDDVLLLIAAIDDGPTVSAVSDVNSVAWAELFTESLSNTGLSVWHLVAGSDDASPSDVTLTLSANKVTNAVVCRISGAYIAGTYLDHEVTSATASSDKIDPPSLSPAWGSADTLWVAGGCQQQGTNTVDAGPTDYTLVEHASTGFGTSGVTLSVYERDLAAATEDPGEIDYATNNVGRVAFTIAVRPAGPAASTVDVPAVAAAQVLDPTVARRVTVPAVTATVPSPLIATAGTVDVPLVAAAQALDPTVVPDQNVTVPLLDAATPLAADVDVDANTAVDVPAVAAAQVLDPTVARRVAVPAVTATVPSPLVGKTVALDAEAHVTFDGTALATVTLTIDETPANDDPLTVAAGTLQLAEDALTGATTLVLTATTLTGTVEAGDTVTISGTEFTVTGSATAEGNEITVAVAPPVPA